MLTTNYNVGQLGCPKGANSFFVSWLPRVASVLLLLLLNEATFAQNKSSLQEYTACNACVYATKGGVFYDDGGKNGAVGNEPLVTTFEARQGFSLIFYFTEIDLPQGAVLKVYKGNAVAEEQLLGSFTKIRKVPNIIGEQLTIQYIPAPYHTPNKKGWTAHLKEELSDKIVQRAVATQPESDCPNAISLCANSTVVALGGLYTDLGNIDDDSGSCYGGTGSGGSVWYSFSPQSNGPLDFTLTPTGTTDYDFVLWDITAGCQSGQRTELACNYSVATGNTGMSSINCSEAVGSCTGNDCTNQSKPSDCNRFNGRVNVQTTRKYALCVNFYSGSNDGFTLAFKNEASSVSITDQVPPTILNAYSTNCTNATNFHLTFSEWVDCTTLQASDFTLAGHTVAITTTNCNNNRTNAIDISVSPALTTGTYSINAQNILDLCGNNMNSNYNIILGTPPTPAVTTPATVCKSPGFLGIGYNYSPSSQNLTASGGNFYSWSVGQLGASLTVAPTSNTTYTVTIANNSCASTRSVTVNVEQAIISLGADANYCGTPVVLTALPAVAGNTYQFFTNPNIFGNGTSVQNGASNTLTVSPAANTVYRVVVTSANGCTAIDDVNVTIATGSTATINNIPATTYCVTSNPITLSAAPTGGTFSGPGVTGNVFSPSAAGVGTHTIAYTVTNGCGTFNGTKTVTVATGTPPSLSLAPSYCLSDADATLTTSPNCGTLTGTGATSGTCLFGFYVLSPTFSPSNAGIGTHYITYTPTSGCSNTFTTTVVGAGATPTIAGANGPYCSTAAAVTLTGSPTGGTFSGVGMSGNSFNPATAGVGTHIITYNVTSCGTTLTNSVAIQVVAANASATIAYSTASFCNGITTPQSITQTGTSGGSYTATPAGLSIDATTGAITPSTSAANTYTVTYTIQGAAGCPPFSTTTTVTIGTLNATATSANNISCSQTNSVLTATGGGTYAWSGGGTAATKTVTAAGIYTVTVTNSGCTTTATVSVTGNTTPPNATATSANNLSCTQTSSILTATGGGTYIWSGGGTAATKTVTMAGTYTVTVTNTTNGCTATRTVTVTGSSAGITATATSANNISCTQTSSVLTATGGGTYAWSGGGTAATKTVTVAGIYTVTVTNGTCTTTTTVNVTGNTTPPTATATSANNLTCTQTSAVLTATGGGTYAWSGGGTAATKTVTAAGIYTVTVTNTANGCATTKTVTVTSNTTPPTATATSANNLTCTQTSSVLTATGGGTYTWSGGGTTATKTVTAAGTYTVTVTNTTNGCTATRTVTVTSNATPVTATVTSSNNITCAQTSATLTATPNTGVSYLWSGGGTAATKTVTAAGTYIVTVTNTTNGCTGTSSVIVTRNVTNVLTTASSASVLTCTQESSVLTATPSTGVTYLWSNGSTTASTTATVGGTYVVTVTNPANSCTGSTTVNVVVSIPIPTGLYTFSTTSTTTNLGWSSVSVATSYCLDYRPTGTTTWTTICNIPTSATSSVSYALTGLNPATTYQFRVRTICGNNQTASVNSATGSFTTTAATSYCSSQGQSTTNNSFIQTVALGSYQNNSGNNNGYGNFLSTVWTLSKGTQYGISITPGYIRSSEMVCYRVWIDYNHDNDFGDNEEAIVSQSTSSRSPILSDFVIPPTALLGNTRMRVSFKLNACPTQCATNISLGEVEDYTINITGASLLNKSAANHSIGVFPNPTHNTVTVRTNGETNLAAITVLDIRGAVITQLYSLNDIQQTVDLSLLPSGVYLFQIATTDGNKSYHKVVKE